MDCLFCRIATHALPATVRFEDEQVIAFDDIHPKAPTHVLIIPKQHIARVHDLAPGDTPLMGHLVLAATTIARGAGLGEAGYRLVVNCGRDGGQEVDHLHLHLIGGRQLGGMA